MEKELITRFVKSNDEETTLYISGPPGTGKTALVNSILRDFTSDSRVISINCMALNTVDELWDRIIEELADPKKVKGGRGKKLVKGREGALKALGGVKAPW